MFRVLKPNGVFVFIEHGKHPEGFTKKIQESLTPVWKHMAGGCHLDREIDRLINEAGFEIKKLKKFQQKPKLLSFMYKGIAVAKK